MKISIQQFNVIILAQLKILISVSESIFWFDYVITSTKIFSNATSNIFNFRSNRAGLYFKNESADYQKWSWDKLVHGGHEDIVHGGHEDKVFGKLKLLYFHCSLRLLR